MRLERSFPIKQDITFKVHLLSSVHAHCTNELSTVDMQVASSPGPVREEKEPGTHCLRMLIYTKNLRGSDIS